MRAALLFLLVASLASAQTGEVVGVVTEAGTGEALIGAAVRLTGTPRGAVTDVNGRFILTDVPIGTYTVNASYVGFRSANREVAVTTRPAEPLRLELDVTEGVISCYQETYCATDLDKMMRGAFVSRVVWYGDRARVDAVAEAECPRMAENMAFTRTIW